MSADIDVSRLPASSALSIAVKRHFAQVNCKLWPGCPCRPPNIDRHWPRFACWTRYENGVDGMNCCVCHRRAPFKGSRVDNGCPALARASNAGPGAVAVAATDSGGNPRNHGPQQQRGCYRERQDDRTAARLCYRSLRAGDRCIYATLRLRSEPDQCWLQQVEQDTFDPLHSSRHGLTRSAGFFPLLPAPEQGRHLRLGDVPV